MSKIYIFFSSLKKSPFLSHNFKPILYTINLTLFLYYLYFIGINKIEPNFFKPNYNLLNIFKYLYI